MIEGVDTTEIDSSVDLGWERETRVRPCARRIGNAWCREPDGHEGMCIAPVPRPIAPSTHGPPAWGRR